MTTDFFQTLEDQLRDATRTHRPRRRRRAVARGAGALAAVAAAAVLAVVLLTAGDGAQPGRSAAPPAATVPATTARTPVAVLNATTAPGLARDIALRLDPDHFRLTNVTNAPRQDVVVTRVLFARGHEQDARAVIRGADLARRGRIDAELLPLDAATRAVAGADAAVVVVVGSDARAR